MECRTYVVGATVDVDEVWDEVQRAIEATGLPTFPTMPELKRLHSVMWPDDDPAGFIDLIGELRPPLIYTLVGLFGEEDITDEQPLMKAAGVAGDALLATTKSHFGELCSVMVGFMAGGIFHLWHATSPWYDDFYNDVERLQEVADELEVLRHTEGRGEHLHTLAHHPDFAKAKYEVERTALAGKVVPGWDGWPRHDVSAFIWEAKAMFDAEVLPGIEQALARQGWEHVRSGGAGGYRRRADASPARPLRRQRHRPGSTVLVARPVADQYQTRTDHTEAHQGTSPK